MILFVTSFSRDLYEASGVHLLSSFDQIQKSGKFLICHEDCGDLQARPHDGRMLLFDQKLHDDFLRTWLEDNRDVIPKHLGGDCPDCNCPGREERHAKHKYGCPGQWMNRNASRWFRKVAALRTAVSVAGTLCRYLVWLDSDVVFRKELPEAYVAARLQGAGAFYFRGHRPAVESGIMVFDLKNGGDVWIKEICRTYASKAYRKYERWDDGFIWAKLFESRVQPKAHDLVLTAKRTLDRKEKPPSKNDVIPTTTIHAYLQHRKGLHGRGLNIMK